MTARALRGDWAERKTMPDGSDSGVVTASTRTSLYFHMDTWESLRWGPSGFAVMSSRKSPPGAFEEATGQTLVLGDTQFREQHALLLGRLGGGFWGIG